jgi:TolA-binding protein
MSAADEIKRAAAGLRKASQMRRDELRDLNVKLHKAKTDYDGLALAIRAEQSALKQRLGQERDATGQTNTQSKIDEAGTLIVRYKDDHDREVRSLEQRIRELEQQISQYDQEAVQLEQQATAP